MFPHLCTGVHAPGVGGAGGGGPESPPSSDTESKASSDATDKSSGLDSGKTVATILAGSGGVLSPGGTPPPSVAEVEDFMIDEPEVDPAVVVGGGAAPAVGAVVELPPPHDPLLMVEPAHAPGAKRAEMGKTAKSKCFFFAQA